MCNGLEVYVRINIADFPNAQTSGDPNILNLKWLIALKRGL